MQLNKVALRRLMPPTGADNNLQNPHFATS